MGPHANYLDDPLLLVNLINKAVLQVYAAGVGAGQVTDELLEARRALERIAFQNA
jgi:hypothetical protein